MGFFSKLLGNNVPAAAAPPHRPPLTQSPASRQIGYDATLVDSLLHDHATLGGIYRHIGELQSAARHDDLRAELVNFKSRLEAHVLTENVRFYTYLEQSLDADNAEVMHDFRREMNTIARTVVNFVKQYQAAAFTPSQRQQFASDYKKVGEVLEHRLDAEESNLYQLYQPV